MRTDTSSCSASSSTADVVERARKCRSRQCCQRHEADEGEGGVTTRLRGESPEVDEQEPSFVEVPRGGASVHCVSSVSTASWGPRLVWRLFFSAMALFCLYGASPLGDAIAAEPTGWGTRVGLLAIAAALLVVGHRPRIQVTPDAVILRNLLTRRSPPRRLACITTSLPTYEAQVPAPIQGARASAMGSDQPGRRRQGEERLWGSQLVQLRRPG